ADRRTLIRRVYLDLIGLPPTPEEVEAFVADRSPTAFETVVDRLLASPRFGERWGRHFLDVARYAETTGKTVNVNYPHAWRYRDHTFAPIPQKDYYALAGIFRSTETCYGTIRFVQSQRPSPLIPLPAESGAPAAVEKLSAAERKRTEEQIKTVQERKVDQPI